MCKACVLKLVGISDGMNNFMMGKFNEAVSKDMGLFEEPYMMHLELYESWASATDDAIIDIIREMAMEDLMIQFRADWV